MVCEVLTRETTQLQAHMQPQSFGMLLAPRSTLRPPRSPDLACYPRCQSRPPALALARPSLSHVPRSRTSLALARPSLSHVPAQAHADVHPILACLRHLSIPALLHA
ncbi:hypothetical protein DICSQDRAFT_172210 [Dichomitus squalens LYAD-421 SS1]|uniref:Uncharacterized protein n=1 Tax=Dichomitus squalens (strain LYAD-421) TaxID=732165 RepID=R7SU18_DICSQ|nr:uncharacterized protein DICSQDRAFT_172210 [Dichomitus squalens LYAD-421 SS1]EJF59225.1 hypothetical protein DICSQDRAFT_172210 [Dichomitus squalens LYAD-421 SS1]